MIFKKITVSFEKVTFQKNFVIIEEELDGIDIDGIGNLEEDSPKFAFIDEWCENLIEVNDGTELTRNKNQKKTSGVLHQSTDLHYVANVVGESISSVTMNQLGKHDFSWGAVVNNLQDKKLFLIKWIEIALTQFFRGAIGTVPLCKIEDTLTMLWMK